VYGYDKLVMHIAQLDEAHDLGEMDNETYRQKRAALHQQAVFALHQVNLA